MRKSRLPTLIATGIVVLTFLAVPGARMISLHASARPPTSYHRVFQSPELRFRYPEAWKARSFFWAGHFGMPLVYVSNQKMHQPCGTKRVSGSLRSYCGWPLNRLRRGGVFAEWSAGPLIGLKLAQFPGRRAEVDGVRAVRRVRFPGYCRYIGGTETIQVYLVRSGNLLRFMGCVRQPRRLAHINKLEALIRSTRFT